MLYACCARYDLIVFSLLIQSSYLKIKWKAFDLMKSEFIVGIFSATLDDLTENQERCIVSNVSNATTFAGQTNSDL